MVYDNRNAWLWTGGVSAAIVVLLVALWMFGVFDASTVQ